MSYTIEQSHNTEAQGFDSWVGKILGVQRHGTSLHAFLPLRIPRTEGACQATPGSQRVEHAQSFILAHTYIHTQTYIHTYTHILYCCPFCSSTFFQKDHPYPLNWLGNLSNPLARYLQICSGILLTSILIKLSPPALTYHFCMLCCLQPGK